MFQFTNPEEKDPPTVKEMDSQGGGLFSKLLGDMKKVPKAPKNEEYSPSKRRSALQKMSQRDLTAHAWELDQVAELLLSGTALLVNTLGEEPSQSGADTLKIAKLIILNAGDRLKRLRQF